MLEASITKSKIRFKETIGKLQAENSTISEALAMKKAKNSETQSIVDSMSDELHDLKHNVKFRYDQITFANGQSFVGQAIQFDNNLITIRSASGKGKTGPLSIVKHIDFHLTGLDIEEFPEVQKRMDTPRKSAHAQVMARFNPRLVFIEVKRGDRNSNDRRSYGNIEEDVQLKVSIGYKNPQSKLEGCTLEVFALGRDLSDKKTGELILRENFRLKPIGLSEQKIETKIKRISYHKYNYSSDHGINYYSYLAVLKDSEGEIIHTKGTRSSIEAMYSQLRHLDDGDSFRY